METNSKRTAVLSAAQLIGIGGFVYLAYKKQKGFWGYVGFIFLGSLAGGIAGGLVSNIVGLKKPVVQQTGLPKAINGGSIDTQNTK